MLIACMFASVLNVKSRRAPCFASELMLPDGFATLSLAPLTAFEAVNTVLEKPFYEVHAVSVRGGRVPSSFGMKVDTECATDATFDTLLVGSAPDVRPSPPELISFLRGVLPKRGELLRSASELLSWARRACSTAAAPQLTGSTPKSFNAAIRRFRWKWIGYLSLMARSGLQLE